jgi:hypothetical protein
MCLRAQRARLDRAAIPSYSARRGMADLVRPSARTEAGGGSLRRGRKIRTARAGGVSAVSAPAALVALVAASTVLRGWWATTHVPTPWIQPDEAVYAELGRSLWASGHLTLLGAPTAFYSLVYPAITGGPLSLADRELGFTLLQWLQALVISLAAVPVYLWGRSLVARRWALAAAALTIAVPGLAYAGLVMTEVAFYPVLVLAAWATARALERPERGPQAVAVGAIVLAAATRLQALVLVPACIAAALLEPLLARSGRRGLVRHAPFVGALLALAGAWTLWQAWRSGATTGALGAYRAAGETHYGAVDAARYVVYHAADLLLLTGIVPVLALALVTVEAVRRGERSGAVRAYLAVALSFVVATVVEVGVFASRHVGFLAERNLLALAPLIFLGLAVWLDRDGPGGWVALGAAAGAAALLLAALPMEALVRRAAVPDAVSLVPFLRLDEARPRANLDLLVVTLVVPAFALLALVSRRRLAVVPAVVLLVLGGASIAAARTVASESQQLQARVLGPDVRWIDHAATGPVTFLYAGEAHWNDVYESLFWNERLRRVLTLPGPPVPGPIPQTPVGPRSDGVVVDAQDRPAPVVDVVAPSVVSLFGTRRAEATGTDLALWHPRRPLRLSTWLIGMRFASITASPRGDLSVTGDVSSWTRLVVYACGRDRLALSLIASSDHPGPTFVALRRDGSVVRRVRLGPWQRWQGALSLAPRSPTVPSPEDVRAPRSRERGCAVDLITSDVVHLDLFALSRA